VFEPIIVFIIAQTTIINSNSVFTVFELITVVFIIEGHYFRSTWEVR